MKLDLQGKRALVTGASQGIGKSIAVALAAEGAHVALVARDETRLRSVLNEIGGSENGHVAKALDLMPEGAPSHLASFLGKQFGPVDVVVHGIGGTLGISNPLCAAAEWRKIWRLNLEIAIELNIHLIPVMREKKRGRVVHISSVCVGENLGPAPYCSVKAALNAYTRSFGRIFAQDGLVIAAVSPGAILSEGGPWAIAEVERPEHVQRYVQQNLPLKMFGKPEDVSHFVAFLCSDHASQFCGSVVPLDGGLGRRFS